MNTDPFEISKVTLKPVKTVPGLLKPAPTAPRAKAAQQVMRMRGSGRKTNTAMQALRVKSFGKAAGSADPFLGSSTSEISKDQPKASAGRKATGTLLPGWHGAVAGKKGHKLDAAGNEYLGSVIGSVGGGTAGALTGAAIGAATRKPDAALMGTGIGGYAGGVTGSLVGSYKGTKAAQRKGHYKKQDLGKAADPFEISKISLKPLMPLADKAGKAAKTVGFNAKVGASLGQNAFKGLSAGKKIGAAVGAGAAVGWGQGMAAKKIRTKY